MVTVCPQCKTVYKFGVMECHETMSKFVMECHDEVDDMRWSMLLIFTDKVSTGNVEMNSTMSKLRNHRDSIREGTVKQCNDKTWKATHSRSGAHSLQVNENRSQFGHVNTVIGKCSLEDSVSEEESMGAEQFEGSREFNDNVGRASRTVERTQMQNIAMDENSNRIHSSKERLNSITTYKRISTSLET